MRLTVVVEKEQVALLAEEAVAFLDRIGLDYPEEPAESATLHPSAAEVTEPAVPLFRARMIGLGFEPDRKLVLLELRERAEDDEDDETGVPTEDGPPRRGVRRPDLRHPRAGAGHGGPRRGVRDGWSAPLPALQLPDGPGRSHLPPLELTARWS